jgi:hypothetical protein
MLQQGEKLNERQFALYQVMIKSIEILQAKREAAQESDEGSTDSR